MDNQEDLVTGFFSAIFHYFADQKLGEIQSIKTNNQLILIRKVQEVYISLIISLFKSDGIGKNVISEKNWFLNKRLEEISTNILTVIGRKVSVYLSKNKIRRGGRCPDNMIFSQIEKEIDEIIKQGVQKIEIIKKLANEKEDILNQIYENI